MDDRTPESRFVAGMAVGHKFCEALCLDANKVVSINVDLNVAEAAYVNVEYLLRSDEADDLVTELKRYQLVEADADAEG